MWKVWRVGRGVALEAAVRGLQLVEPRPREVVVLECADAHVVEVVRRRLERGVATEVPHVGLMPVVEAQLRSRLTARRVCELPEQQRLPKWRPERAVVLS